MPTDQNHMRRCIDLAREAKEEGDFPFGSLIADSGGNPVAEGRNREVTESDVTWHAEMEAVRNATRKLRCRSLEGMTLYASGEPCLMCAVAIRRAGISRVVVAARTANPIPVEPHPFTAEAFGDTPMPRVTYGILEREALEVQDREPSP